MKSLVERFRSIGSKNLADKLQDDEQLARQVMALFTMLSELYGPDKLVLKVASWTPSSSCGRPDRGQGAGSAAAGVRGSHHRSPSEP